MAKVAVCFVGWLTADPVWVRVASEEMPVLYLAVPRRPADFDAGMFAVEVLTPRPETRSVAEKLVEGCQVRVSGTLDVGESPRHDGERRWGLQLTADEITPVEVDLGDRPDD